MKHVSNDGITGNHRIGEDSIAVVLARNFKREHGLFLKMLEAHFFGFGNVGFLVEDLIVGHGQSGGLGEGGGGMTGAGEGLDGEGRGEARDGGGAEDGGCDGCGVG